MAGSKKNSPFEMGAHFSDNWQSDNKSPTSSTKQIIKPQNQHQLHVRFEKRKGKPVTMVGLFFYGDKDLKMLHKKIKKSLACGGGIELDTEKNGYYLLFQGDHKDKIKPLFEKVSWKFKS
jgi:translation initiation factor 1